MRTAKCPTCGGTYRVPDGADGSRLKCPKCNVLLGPPDSDPPEVVSQVPPAAPSMHSENPGGKSMDLLRRWSGANCTSNALNITKIILAVSLVLVVYARGADTIGRRNVARAQAKLAASKATFEDKWKDKLRSANVDTSRMRELQMKQYQAADADEREKINAEIKKISEGQEKISKERDEEEKKLEDGEWRTLSRNARDAEMNNDLWSYWREWLFVLASIGVIVGCVHVGFTGTGVERVVCLVMVGIIVFSIYIAGAAWLTSTVSNAKAGVI